MWNNGFKNSTSNKRIDKGCSNSEASLPRRRSQGLRCLLSIVIICIPFLETAACPHNTYNDGSTIYCQPCPANSGHSLTGSRSVFDCKCFKGYQGRPESGNPCTGEKHLFFAPSTRYFLDVFENGSFLSVSISLLSIRKRRFRAPETLVFIYDPQRGDF